MIWGGSYAGVKTVQEAVPPLALAAFRSAVAAAVLLGGLALLDRRLPALGRRDWASVALLGLVGTTAFQLCMVGGLHFTTPAHSALMITLNPVFAAFLAWAWLGERLQPWRVLGILLSLAGVGLIVTRGGAGLGGGALLGDGLSLGAGLAWAVYSVLGKPVLAARPPLQVTALAMAIGAVPLLALGLPALAAVPWAALPAGTWALLGYLSVLALGLGYFLWYWALARAATARVAVFTYLTPVVAVTISIGLGLETLSGTLLAGAVAVIGGVMLAQAT